MIAEIRQFPARGALPSSTVHPANGAAPTAEQLYASYLAGMAEVATSVLHNAGNILNSINVSASVIAATVRNLRTESLGRLASLIRDHEDDLAKFLTEDAKGRMVPQLLEGLARERDEERTRLLDEIRLLQENINLIREIISTQRAYVTTTGVTERLDGGALIEEALRLHSNGLARHRVQVAFQRVPAILARRDKVLQILAALIDNAKRACEELRDSEGTIILRLESVSPKKVRLVVQDNGSGFPSDQVIRIFAPPSAGQFNDRGLRLHAAANSAKEMGGSLTAQSGGRSSGATFILELPVAPA